MLTSEIRQKLAREWYSKRVPICDIVRLLGIEREELVEMLERGDGQEKILD